MAKKGALYTSAVYKRIRDETDELAQAIAQARASGYHEAADKANKLWQFSGQVDKAWNELAKIGITRPC